MVLPRRRKGLKRGLDRAVASVLDHARLNYLMAWLRYRDRPNSVFLKLPKTAGTSIRLALGIPKYKKVRSVRCSFPQTGPVTFEHLDYKQLLDRGLVSPEFDATAFKFTFVRNPFDRMVSLYHYLKRRGRLSKSITFLGFCRLVDRTDVDPVGLVNALNLSQCNPQVRWTEHIALDYVGRFERLEAGVREVAERLEIPFADLPHERASVRTDYVRYYCDESLDIVKRLYAEDFVAFDYDSAELDRGR